MLSVQVVNYITVLLPNPSTDVNLACVPYLNVLNTKNNFPFITVVSIQTTVFCLFPFVKDTSLRSTDFDFDGINIKNYPQVKHGPLFICVHLNTD